MNSTVQYAAGDFHTLIFGTYRITTTMRIMRNRIQESARREYPFQRQDCRIFRERLQICSSPTPVVAIMITK